MTDISPVSLSFGMGMMQLTGLTTVAVFLAELLGEKENTVRQRLREWYRDAGDKKGSHRQEIDVTKLIFRHLKHLPCGMECVLGANAVSRILNVVVYTGISPK